MQFIKGLFRITLGVLLMASGIVLEVMWLGFCFGTVIVGIVLFLWFTPILFLPFELLFLPGWHFFWSAWAELNRQQDRKLNVRKVSGQIARIVGPQFEEIEETGDLCPLDERVAAYVAALSVVVRNNPHISVANTIDVTSTFFTAEKYQVRIKNLFHCIDRSDDYKEFWELVRTLFPVAQQELVSGRGYFLINHYRAERNRLRRRADIALDVNDHGLGPLPAEYRN